MQKIIFLLLLTVVFFATPTLAAVDIGQNMAKDVATKSGYENASDTTLSQTVGKYIRVALSLVGTIFLALTVYAGFLWMTASGNEEQVTKATDIIKMAVIGLAITLAAYSITAFVISKIGGASENNQGTGTPSPAGGGTWEEILNSYGAGYNQAASK